jgi:D-glycero-D-manno-heptose 1,7-bisphosphate phosphatase
MQLRFRTVIVQLDHREHTVQRPTQAVILAGGLGTRLRPLTDVRPKPMIEMHGKPFLEYLVEMLREQGFERILLLLGYLPEVVQNHFGDGRRWGVTIEYSVTAVENDTGRRVKLAAPQIDECFLLMYCDNYWPMQMGKMWDRFMRAKVPAMLTVYRNMDGYTKNSLAVDSKGYVTVYDKTCTSPDLQGVEISYAILKKSVLDLLPEDNVQFERTVYPQLAEQRQLLAFVTDHRYYSVGSLQRLPLTESFLGRRPTVILDRDGVLNKKPPKAQYVTSWHEFEWLAGAKEALRLFNEAGYRVIVVSNQAGVARGGMTETQLLEIHERMKLEAVQAGGLIEAIYYCPHNWDDGCECRKPKPGMLFQAQRDHHLDLSRVVFIGDDIRDAEAADSAGCSSVLVSEDFTLLDASRAILAHGQDSLTVARN